MNEEYRNQIKDVIVEMTQVACLPESFAEDFFNELMKDEVLVKEFVTYVSTQKFLSEEKICDYSVVDIMVWQMDHFRAFMDRGLDSMKHNECEMILKAFDTFMKMKKDPDKYVRLLTEETGSDFEGKFK